MNKSFAYLAIPYTVNPQESYSWSCLAVSLYSNEQVTAYSPIVHMHPVAEKYDLPGDVKFWKFANQTMIKACGSVHVLVPIGWESLVLESKGIKMEVKYGHGVGRGINIIQIDSNAKRPHPGEAEIMHTLLYGS